MLNLDLVFTGSIRLVTLWSTAVYVRLHLPGKLIPKSCGSSAQILHIPSRLETRLPAKTGIPTQRRGPNAPWFGPGTRVSRSANTATPSLRSFARPLALHECVISSALVWWQLTSGKSLRQHAPPPPPPHLWVPLLTRPLMHRPHVCQAGPSLDCAPALHQQMQLLHDR